jgi:hypothetical protein
MKPKMAFLKRQRGFWVCFVGFGGFVSQEQPQMGLMSWKIEHGGSKIEAEQDAIYDFVAFVTNSAWRRGLNPALKRSCGF